MRLGDYDSVGYFKSSNYLNKVFFENDGNIISIYGSEYTDEFLKQFNVICLNEANEICKMIGYEDIYHIVYKTHKHLIIKYTNKNGVVDMDSITYDTKLITYEANNLDFISDL